MGAAGSSPRGRGKRQDADRRSRPPGLIPAGAGKTASVRGMSGSRAAHPRGGGENGAPAIGAGADDGSSPRGRGKLAVLAETLHPVGLIPAGAGKTGDLCGELLEGWAHPRGGGENRRRRTRTGRPWGSSPRGRGKQTFDLAAWIAGVAHPRGGGENRRRRTRTGRPWGSSPRGRGKQTFDLAAWIAGVAHPRGGGENLDLLEVVAYAHGSSPRGRGKLCDACLRGREGRLIPAGAGKTRPRMTVMDWRAAHPRGGGENRKVPLGASGQAGSSPRGRGKQAEHY